MDQAPQIEVEFVDPNRPKYRGYPTLFVSKRLWKELMGKARAKSVPNGLKMLAHIPFMGAGLVEQTRPMSKSVLRN